MLRSIVVGIYRCLQEHYITFRLLVFLKECGITRKINYLTAHPDDKKLKLHPTKEMIKSEEFFAENSHLILEVKKLFFDDFSAAVFDSCIEYRTKRIPIPSDYCMENNQYFVDDIFIIDENEVFIDGGAYTGDTIQQFIDVAKKKKIKSYKIIAFEPSNKYFEIIRRFFEKKKNVVVIKKGLSDGEKDVLFVEDGATSRITDQKDNNTEKIETIAIDLVPECIDATYIKMDIEGEEMNALKGARQTIIRNKPKLAICIYHSNEDMIRIAQYVHNLVPEYRLFVRHHSRSDVETVLYATI